MQSFLGEPRAEELLVVRYPNQRRFFALALNPYYIAVANPQRLKAIRKFEASFMHSPDSLRPLRRSKWVLAVCFHEAPDAIQAVVETAGGQLVYQSNETSPIVITKRFHPANTNPFVFERTGLFRFEDQESCEAAMRPGALNQLREAAGRGVGPALQASAEEGSPTCFASEASALEGSVTGNAVDDEPQDQVPRIVRPFAPAILPIGVRRRLALGSPPLPFATSEKKRSV